MNIERAQVGWGFWLWWVLASTVGFAVGGVVGGVVGGKVGQPVGGAVFGASVGIAQWLVLRRQVSRPSWWVLASTVGFAVGFAMGGEVGRAVGFAVSGASVGIAQWLVLRRWQVSQASWWVLASTVVFAVFGAVAFAVSDEVVGAGALLVAMPVYGAITGGVLVWLLRQPRADEYGLHHRLRPAPTANQISMRQSIGLRFLLRWVAYSAGALPLAMLGVLLISGEVVAEEPGLLRQLGGFALGAAGGLGVGLVQWNLLRSMVSRSGWWVAACVWFGALGGAVAAEIPIAVAIPLIVPGAVLGASLGVRPLLVLRREVTQIPARLVASGAWGTAVALLGLLTSLTAIGVEEDAWSGFAFVLMTFLIVLAVIGAVAGTVSGAFLIRVLREQ